MVKFDPKPIYEDLALHARGPKKLTILDKAEIKRLHMKLLLRAIPAGKISLRSLPFSPGFLGGQRSVCKVSYQANQHKDQWKAHGRYLARKGAQQAQERGLGFDQHEEAINIVETLSGWQEAGDPRLWKVIISPEEGHRLDLKEHVRSVMENVERDMKRKLQWVAVDHYNTEHPHAHVSIRGLCKNGAVLRIDQNYFTKGFRERSCREATRVLGLRLSNDMLKRRELAISKRYVTELDREIERRLDKYRTITFDKRPETGVKHEKELQLKDRLRFLETLGMAIKEDAITWKVADHHMSHLKYIQTQDDIVKAHARHMERIQTKDLQIVDDSLSKVGDKVLGRVVGMGVNELNEDKRYLIVEGVDNHIHYIEATKAITELRDSRKLQDGDVIYLERREALRQEPVRFTQKDFSQAGLDGEKVFETLLKRGVLELRTGAEAEMVHNMATTERAVKFLFPDNAEKIMAVFETVTKIKFLHVNRLENFQDIRQAPGTHEIDRYLVGMVEKTKAAPELRPNEASVRAQFLEVAQERITKLRQLGVIKQDWSIDRERLEHNLGREPYRGLELRLDRE